MHPRLFVLYVRVSFLVFLREYLIVRKNILQKHWEQINAIDGTLTENFS